MKLEVVPGLRSEVGEETSSTVALTDAGCVCKGERGRAQVSVGGCSCGG